MGEGDERGAQGGQSVRGMREGREGKREREWDDEEGVAHGGKRGRGKGGGRGGKRGRAVDDVERGAGARLVQPRLPFLPHVAGDTISTDGANSDMRDSG